MKSRGISSDEIRAHLYAHNRRFRECVQLLQQMGAEQRALEMFADLRMFEQAQVLHFPKKILIFSGISFGCKCGNAEVVVAKKGRLGTEFQ